MIELVSLSHFISEETPGYGGKAEIRIRPARSIEKGDSCNQKKLFLSNHIGTHVDFPLHFTRTGKSIDHYPVSF